MRWPKRSGAFGSASVWVWPPEQQEGLEVVPELAVAVGAQAAISMRSPQGSRFHSDGGEPQLIQATGNPGSASG